MPEWEQLELPLDDERRHQLFDRRLKQMHKERDGYCDACWRPFPCPTLQLLEEGC